MGIKERDVAKALQLSAQLFGRKTDALPTSLAPIRAASSMLYSMNMQLAREKIELTKEQVEAGYKQIVTVHKDTTGKVTGGGKIDMMGVCLNVTTVDPTGAIASVEVVACPMTECQGHDGKSEAASLEGALAMLDQFRFGTATATLVLSAADEKRYLCAGLKHQVGAFAELAKLNGVLDVHEQRHGVELRVEYDRALTNPDALVAKLKLHGYPATVTTQEKPAGHDILRKIDFLMSDGASTATKVNMIMTKKIIDAKSSDMGAEDKTELARVTLLYCGKFCACWSPPASSLPCTHKTGHTRAHHAVDTRAQP